MAELLAMRTKHMFMFLFANVLQTNRIASNNYDPNKPSPIDPIPLWWLMCHLNMLLLAPTGKDERDGVNIANTIT